MRIAALIIIIGVVVLHPHPTYAAPLHAPSSCATAISAALTKLGSDYVWGAKGPDEFDCSGLTYWAYLQSGLNIGLSTYDQVTRGTQTACNLSHLNGASTTCWEPGDLAFLKYPSGQHVALYAGNGLFVDAYNENTGVILHAIEDDSFYQAHWWQARRVADCSEGDPPDPPSATPTLPLGQPAIEVPDLASLPDLLSYAAFAVDYTAPECEAEPVSGGLTDVLYPFRWLFWRINASFNWLICILASFLQIALNAMSTMANIVIAGINGIWRLAIYVWLSARTWMINMWMLIEYVRDLGMVLQNFFALVAAWIQQAWVLGGLLMQLIGQFLLLALQVVGVFINLLGYVALLGIRIFLDIIGQFGSTALPSVLSTTHPAYEVTHGVLEAFRQSLFGWVFVLAWGMAYVAWLLWMSRYLSSGGE